MLELIEISFLSFGRMHKAARSQVGLGQMFTKLATTALAIGLVSTAAWAQSSISIDFLYGSKPRRAYVASEPKWFGGKLGGHVGIAFAADSILNFVPAGKFHWAGHRDPKHSRYVVTNRADFETILGGSAGPLKTMSITIPLDAAQSAQLRSLRQRYLSQAPYDYAFLGMRCASATDEVLAKLGITRRRSYWGTIFGTFYPKALRHRLRRIAARQGWEVRTTAGSAMRKWQHR
jgi:hypothetical protein